jgi:hypothetical protein
MKAVKILAVAALMVASTAYAKGYVGFELSDETKRSDDSSKGKIGIVVGVKAAGGMDYSLKMDNSQAKLGDGDISTNVEARVKKSFAPISAYSIAPYLGVRVGQKIEDDANFNHYAVDYGVKFPIIGKAVYLDLGGRHRNAFDTDYAFRSNRAHALVSVNVTKKDTIGVRYSQSYGDVGEEKNAWRLNYTRSF